MSTLRQIINFFRFGYDTQSLLISSLVITAVAILLPILTGFLLNLLEKIQIKLFSVVNKKFAYIFANYITFPGTFIHEMSHLTLAFITGAKIREVCFFETKGGSLGHVSFSTRGPKILQMIQHSLSACAPTVVGIASGYFLVQYIFNAEHSIWGYASLWYLLVSLIDHSSMSNADIKLYFKGVWIFVIPIFAAAFCLMKFA